MAVLAGADNAELWIALWRLCWKTGRRKY